MSIPKKLYEDIDNRFKSNDLQRIKGFIENRFLSPGSVSGLTDDEVASLFKYIIKKPPLYKYEDKNQVTQFSAEPPALGIEYSEINFKNLLLDSFDETLMNSLSDNQMLESKELIVLEKLYLLHDRQDPKKTTMKSDQTTGEEETRDKKPKMK